MITVPELIRLARELVEQAETDIAQGHEHIEAGRAFQHYLSGGSAAGLVYAVIELTELLDRHVSDSTNEKIIHEIATKAQGLGTADYLQGAMTDDSEAGSGEDYDLP